MLKMFTKVLLCIHFLYVLAQANEFQRVDAQDIVVDKMYRLMWQDDAYSSTLDISLADAKIYCEESKFAGYEDWYLPSLDELKTIVEADNYPKTAAKAFRHTASEYYWSSSEYGPEFAWLVLFRNASVDYYYKTDTNHLRCVRKVNDE